MSAALLREIPIPYQGTRMQKYHDEVEDDIVVFNNYIGGNATRGFMFPIPMDNSTTSLLQETIPSIRNVTVKTDKISTEWISSSIKEMDFCCSKAISYTWQWGKIINECLNMGVITPAVYHLMYSMIKSMSRSPKIPPGTKLYILDDQFRNGKCLGFLNCYLNIDDAVAAKNAKDAKDTVKVLMYQIPQDDFVHGLWFSPETGSSAGERTTIVIGPGMSIHFNFINVGDKSSSEPDSIITLKQQDFFFFDFDRQREGDKRYIDSLTYPCVCYMINSKNNHCIIDDALALALQIDNSDHIHYKSSVLNQGENQLANLYISVQTSGAIGIRIDVSLGRKVTIQDEEHLVFKLVSKESDYYVYCTALGALYFCCTGQLLELDTVGQLPAGTIVNHSDQQLSEQIQLIV